MAAHGRVRTMHFRTPPLPENPMPVRILAALFCLLLCLNAAGADDTDPSLITDNYTQQYVIASDGSYRLTVDHAQTLVEQRAVQEHSQYYISYNRTLDKVESIVAYTRKRDGRRLRVSAAHIKDQQEAASADAPMFQDTRLKIVVFPDIEAGDQLVVHYVLHRHTALFPGQFEDLSFSQFYQNPRFNLIYDLPASMPLYADRRQQCAGPQALPMALPRWPQSARRKRCSKLPRLWQAPGSVDLCRLSRPGASVRGPCWPARWRHPRHCPAGTAHHGRHR
jgi:hypothetical protein